MTLSLSKMNFELKGATHVSLNNGSLKSKVEIAPIGKLNKLKRLQEFEL